MERIIENGKAVANQRLKTAFIIFLVLGLLTLINRVTYFVIYFCIGLNQTENISTEKFAKIIVVNNYITNIWYVYLIIAGIIYWLYRKQLKNKVITKEVKMDKDEKKKEVFTGWNWFVLIACALLTLMFLNDGLRANPYSLFWFIVFLIGFIQTYRKLKASKKGK